MNYQAMMEEVLELLASDSPNLERTTSMALSMKASTSDSNNNSGSTGVSHSSRSSTNHDSKNDPNNEMRGCGEVDSTLDNGDQEGRGPSNKETASANDDYVEENFPAGHKAMHYQGADAALGLARQMQNAMPSSFLSPIPAAQIPPVQSPLDNLTSWFPPLAHHPAASRSFTRAVDLIASAAPVPVSNLSPTPAASRMMPGQTTTPVSIPIAPPASIISQKPRELSSPHKKARALSSDVSSKVLPTGQQIHVMNLAEFEELRRKLRMQTASRRYRKRKKEEYRQQKTQIQELQTELVRLQEIEAQAKQYQQRSIESLQEELRIHRDEVTDLSEKVKDAAKVELDWINLMSTRLRK